MISPRCSKSLTEFRRCSYSIVNVIRGGGIFALFLRSGRTKKAAGAASLKEAPPAAGNRSNFSVKFELAGIQHGIPSVFF